MTLDIPPIYINANFLLGFIGGALGLIVYHVVKAIRRNVTSVVKASEQSWPRQQNHLPTRSSLHSPFVNCTFERTIGLNIGECIVCHEPILPSQEFDGRSDSLGRFHCYHSFHSRMDAPAQQQH